MLLKLLLAFTLIPLVELYLLFQLAQATSFPVTLLIVISTGILGSVLARREGVLAWRRLRESFGSQPHLPRQEIRDGLMIAFAAALLLTPGILTDALGFALLIPAGREQIAKHVLPRLFRGVRWNVTVNPTAATYQTTTYQTGDPSKTIDAEAVRSRNESDQDADELAPDPAVLDK